MSISGVADVLDVVNNEVLSHFPFFRPTPKKHRFWTLFWSLLAPMLTMSGLPGGPGAPHGAPKGAFGTSFGGPCFHVVFSGF